MREKSEGRVQYFDLLNVLACFSVVVLHVNSSFWSFEPNARWVANLLIESFFYPAVAIFFMLSGATLLDYRKRYSTKVYFQKRLVRAFIPFVAWSLIAIFFHVLKGQIAPRQLTLPNILGWLVNCDYYSVYWFFAPLFACYLAIPVLSAIPEEKRERLYTYAACFAFVTISVLPMVSRWTGIPYNDALTTPVSAGYLMYVLAGYVLCRRELPRWSRLSLYALGLGALVLRVLMTYRLSVQEGLVTYTYGGYLNFPCVLQALAVFVFMRQRKPIRSPRVVSAVRFLASASFSVYLTHKFIVDLLVRFSLEPAFIADSAWLHSLLWSLVVYGLSVGVYAIGRRIPVIRRIFP